MKRAGKPGAEAPQEPPAWLELDPGIGVTGDGAGLRLFLRGRLAARGKLERATITAGGVAVHRQGFARKDPDGASTVAGDPGLRGYGMFCLFALDAMPPGRRLRLDVTLRLESGEESQSVIVIGFPAGRVLEARVIAGPVCPAIHYAGTWAPVAVNVEAAGCADGALRVSGWAIGLQQVVAVQIWSGDSLLGPAVLDQARPDVAAAFPAYPDAGRAGFSFTASLETLRLAGPEIRVEAVSASGEVHATAIRVPGLAASSQAVPHAGEIRLHCDEAVLSPSGWLRVEGWCLGPAPIARIQIGTGASIAGDAITGRTRLDVARVHKAIEGAAQSGFRFCQYLGLLPDELTSVDITAEDAAGTVAILPVAVISGEDPPEALAASAVESGAADRIRLMIDTPVLHSGVAAAKVTDRLLIEGWAVAREGIASVDVLIGGEARGQAYYGAARQDVAAALPEWRDSLRCGFSFITPLRGLPDGETTVTLRARQGWRQLCRIVPDNYCEVRGWRVASPAARLGRGERGGTYGAASASQLL
jgi:hypothetical protein